MSRRATAAVLDWVQRRMPCWIKGAPSRLTAPRGIATSAIPSSQPLGFRRYEYGLQWYKSKEDLIEASPGEVLVGTSYEYGAASRKSPQLKQVRKYSAFHCHEDYWETIEEINKRGKLQNLHEVFPSHASRCLYFDIDGPPDFGDIHAHIIPWLQQYVRWFFSGDRLDWSANDPEPVVLRSADPSKYSCHVVFPQIQFENYSVQEQYMKVLLSGLPALEVDLEGNESVPILAKLVDHVPYTRFQLFRGPYACKLKNGQLRPETVLEPEGFFRDDPLACFAGHVEDRYALELPSLQRVLEWNPEVRNLHETHQRHVMDAAVEGPRQVSPQDLASLYMECFRQRTGGGILDLGGMTDLEQYEAAFQWLHPERASQWWSWFRICGVTCRMLERYAENRVAQHRIWTAHMAWSSAYPAFNEDENVQRVRQGAGRRVSGLHLLLNLVRFDNPDMQVRTSTWQWHRSTAARPDRSAPIAHP